MRDHEPIKIDQFNGLWDRGDIETIPLDHFSDCDNIKFTDGAFQTRDGVGVFGVDNFIPNVVRMYNYPHGGIQSLLALDSSGNLYDTGSPTPLTPILSIPEMTDFAAAYFGGRAYISPHDGILGLEDEVVYVYLGDGDPAVPAAGGAPANTMGLALSPGQIIEAGMRVFGIVFETNTGFLSEVSVNVGFAAIDTGGTAGVDITTIPLGAANVVKRHIVSTRGIAPALFTGDDFGYQFFFVPGGTIPDNTTTTLDDLGFFDADLIADASHLLDNYEEIPAGVNLTVYHNRLVVMGLFGEANTDPQLDESGQWSTALVSYPGEPESISEVDGLIVAPLDSNPLTAGQEYRDVLYLFKATRTLAYADNGDVPSSWPLVVIDQGVGCSVHGIATVLDSGGVNVEFLLITDFSGVMLFNGGYPRPELSYKIRNFWLDLERDDFKNIQILNDSISQFLYIVLPDFTMLYADYSQGLDPTKIKWTPWSFEMKINTIALIDTTTLTFGSDGELV